MLFQSFAFVLCFLPAAVIVRWILAEKAGRRVAQAWLLACSLFFYGYTRPSSLLLLLASILFNWALARGLGSVREGVRRKNLLRAGVAANVLFLCCFKYANFFLRSLPLPVHMTLPDWSLPLGISFFTLTQVMYLVDTYQGLNGPNSLFDHATMVSLFPYVSSGPLVRSSAIVSQLKEWKLNENGAEAASRGLYVFAIGLVKKVVFADSFAQIADAGFGAPNSLSSVEAWVAAVAYAMQLYFDFSGYSDMALGAARMLGIEIPQNFDAPYRSRSISEFWQRWHISLSGFITNYLYTPLLRSMGKATLRTSAVATMTAMGIAGLWHGPAWTFVIFGLLHGAALTVNQIWKKKKVAKMPDWLGWLLTMVFVIVAFVFFRSADVPAAIRFLGRMMPVHQITGFGNLVTVLPLTPTMVFRPALIGLAVALAFKSSAQLTKSFMPSVYNAAAATGLFLVALFFMNSAPAKSFVYFAF